MYVCSLRVAPAISGVSKCAKLIQQPSFEKLINPTPIPLHFTADEIKQQRAGPPPQMLGGGFKLNLYSLGAV